MRVQEATRTDTAPPPPRRPRGIFLLGLVLGVLGCLVVGMFVVAPLVLAKRNDLPLERLYGDVAVSIASRTGAGNQQNPVANDRRALAAGRNAYTGSCGVCHGATGDGRGVFGTASYPNATDLTSHDAAEKSDGQLFWIIKNGLSFTGMPGFSDQYDDQAVWSLVSYVRALQDPNRAPQAAQGGGNNPVGGNNPGGGDSPGGANPPTSAGNRPPEGFRGQQAFTLAAPNIPAATPDQLDRADPFSAEPPARGAAIYFAQGCADCHGAVGNAPGDLGLERGGGGEATRAIRQGRPGMPGYDQAHLSDADLSDLQAYLATIGSGSRGGRD